MSRGFVREGDQEEVPMVPQRAYLPAGVANFVTPSGMEELSAEKEALIKEKDSLTITNDNERRIALNLINAKLLLLNNRIAEARVVDCKGQPHDEVRFGATVKIRNKDTGNIQTIQIVGVDEANMAKGKISFISPLAKALINKKTGDLTILRRDPKDIVFEILDIDYK